MKKSRHLIVLIMLLTVSLLLIPGCSKTEPTAAPADASKAAPITLTDHAGRSVELPKAAERVIGTHNPSMNLVIVLDGNGKRLAGFGNKDMAYGLYDLAAPEVNQATVIGKGKNINMETIISVKPDLMLLPLRFQSQVDQLAEVGVPCIVLDVEKYDSIKDGLKLVGKAIGQDNRAEELVALFDAKINKASEVAGKAATKPTVLFISGSAKTDVASDNMLQNQMIETAGGIPVTKGLSAQELWLSVNMEQIIKWNPDVIYFPAYASYTVDDILNDPQWANISAVKNKKVYKFPSNLEPWDYNTPGASLGLCWTLYNLHPDLYSYDELMKDVNDFYQFVYGKTFTAEQLGITK
mgnify:CR=1 FL=1|jgi:iron complex transport system substrate-binding protein